MDIDAIEKVIREVALSYGVNEPYLTYLQIQWGIRSKLDASEIGLICQIMRITEWELNGHPPMDYRHGAQTP